jgi:hypothetical protein
MFATLALPDVRIRSAADLREAVRRARGLLRIDSSALDRVLGLDSARALVEVQASAPWTALAEALGVEPDALAAMWRPARTIGMSVATNAAGPDGIPIVAHVEALALVTADGELRRVSRSCEPELFARVVGGQDIFGAPYSITLRLDSLARAVRDARPAVALELGDAGEAGELHLLVPPGRLDAFIAEARERCASWRIALARIEVARSFPEHETFLRWAQREYARTTLFLEEPRGLGACVRSTQLRRELIDAAIAHGGSFAIASTPQATRAQVEACYPGLPALLAEKRRLDPAERLVNSWYRHYRSLFGRTGCEVRWGAQSAA